MILGLDISTSAIGACILSDEEVVFIDFLSFKNEKNIFNKASLFREFLLSIKKRFSISLVVIEENLQAFRPGLSSAKTIVTLARFNGMCSLISSEVFQFFPKFVNVNSARKILGFKKDRKSEKNTKEQILEFVKAREPKIVWPTKVLKNGPRRGSVVLLNECYDMADAYIVCFSERLQEETCQ